MNQPYTRADIRADILEITTTVVSTAINDSIQFEQLQKRFDTLEDRLNVLEDHVNTLVECVRDTNDKIDFAHKLMHVHIANPSAHSRR